METVGRNEKDVMLGVKGRTISTAQHLAARKLMDANEIMKLAPSTLLLMRVAKIR